MYIVNRHPALGELGELGEFGEFGYWQFVVGAIQANGQIGATVQNYSSSKKYIKSKRHTQELTHGQQLAQKKEELASKGRLVDIEGQTEILEDQKIKKLVAVSFITLILVVVIALGIYYVSATGGDDE